MSSNALSSQEKFALEEIFSSLNAREEKAEINLKVDKNADLKSEAFTISRQGTSITVTGKDSAGVMYGGFDLAETIRSSGVDSVQSKSVNHYIKYVSLVTANSINEIWFNRVATLNFKNQIEDTKLDVDYAKEIK